MDQWSVCCGTNSVPLCCGEESQKSRLSVYQSIFLPALTYGHELWVMTERMRLWIQAAEIS